MNKSEFLKQLKNSLVGSLSSNQINDQIEYYNSYINIEVKNGRSEQEVLDELGDPKLIAKTIKKVQNTDSVIDDNIYNNSSNQYYNDNNNENKKNPFLSYTSINSIGCLIAFVFLFIFILSLVLRLIAGGFYLIVYYPTFFIIIILLVVLISIGRKGH